MLGNGLNSANKTIGKDGQGKKNSPVKNKPASGKKPRKLEVRNAAASKKQT